MIQRIQSLYLLLAAALVATTLFLPLALFSDGSSEFVLKAFAIGDSNGTAAQSTVYMGILLAVSALVPFVTIFLFRNRMLQVRLCVAEIVLLVGCLIMMGIYCYLGYRTFSALPFGVCNFNVWLIMPLIALVFVWLAARAIFKDELLVRSLDRIR